jgi:hypothetical protein
MILETRPKNSSPTDADYRAAYMRLEGKISDVNCMATATHEFISNFPAGQITPGSDVEKHYENVKIFLTTTLSEMIDELQEMYLAPISGRKEATR